MNAISLLVLSAILCNLDNICKLLDFISDKLTESIYESKLTKTPSWYYSQDNGFFEENYNEKYWGEQK